MIEDLDSRAKVGNCTRPVAKGVYILAIETVSITIYIYDILARYSCPR